MTTWYGWGERTLEVGYTTGVWYHPGLPPVPLRGVVIRDPHGQFATQASLCTDLATTPDQILARFVLRWQLAVTSEEARRHLGVQTQRQWSDLASQRTTPALRGRCSLVTLLARSDMATANAVRHAAWSHKAVPTFIDALARVRRQLWGHTLVCTAPVGDDLVEVPRLLVERCTAALSSAA